MSRLDFTEKEVFSEAIANIFRSIASLMDAAHTFYKTGRSEQGDRTIQTAKDVIDSLPEFPQ